MKYLVTKTITQTFTAFVDAPDQEAALTLARDESKPVFDEDADDSEWEYEARLAKGGELNQEPK